MAAQKYATQAAQRTALRYRVGQGTSTEILEDGEIDECLDAARDEINRMCPLWSLVTFPTVANQQRYNTVEASIPAAAIGKAKVFWKGGAFNGCSSTGLFTQFGDTYAWVAFEILNGTYNRLVVDQTALMIAARNYVALQDYFGGRGMHLDNNEIWLDPIPGADGINVYYFISVARFATSVSVDTEYSEAFMDYAEMKANDLLALKQSEVASVNCGLGGGTATAGGRIYYNKARNAENRFYSFCHSKNRPAKLYRL
jgi:hypothetical protein